MLAVTFDDGDDMPCLFGSRVCTQYVTENDEWVRGLKTHITGEGNNVIYSLWNVHFVYFLLVVPASTSRDTLEARVTDLFLKLYSWYIYCLCDIVSCKAVEM